MSGYGETQKSDSWAST